MKNRVYVTFVEWVRNGETRKRMHEHYDMDGVNCYANSLNLAEVTACTHVYEGGELVAIIDWNKSETYTKKVEEPTEDVAVEEMEEPDETATVYATDDTHEFFKVATYNRRKLEGFFFTEDYRKAVVKAGFDERVVLLAVGNISGDYIGINYPRD
jgi:hypothetical protein